ncbi:MAG TPA: ABC transporter permease [Candidatus Nanoarchaeia archaeon]|nr:ABC transporter permease [Candidatus Nanoarchaeia archaeon]
MSMINIGALRYAFRNVVHRKMRSGLTIISIFIGVTAIFALLSFGIGIQGYVAQIAEDAGVDKLFIQSKGIGAPGTDNRFFLGENDIDFIRKVNGVNDITGMYLKGAEIVFKKQKRNNFILGVDMNKQKLVEEVLLVDIVQGRSLKKDDLNKVVLGYNYQIDGKIFDRGLTVGDKVELNGQTVEVVGFYDELGNPSDDANIYATYKLLEELYPSTTNKFGYAVIKADKGVDTEELADRIQDRLRRFKNQEEGKEDFFVQTFADVLATFGSIVLVINGVLVLIALISVVVASVNIMNTMYTAVLDRTKEIGVMKAIGAQNTEIMFIFVFEAGLLGLIGGAVGVFFGFLIASAGGAVAASAGFASLQPAFPLALVIGCLLFAFLLGAGAGFLPARQASKLRPVEALRYE